MISAVRSSLRDLIEMIIASLLLHGDAEREDRTDWLDLGLEYVNLVCRLLSITYCSLAFLSSMIMTVGSALL